MATVLSKHFMRTISQAPNEGGTKLSLWTLEDVEKAQAKQRQLDEARAEAEAAEGAMDEDDDEFGDLGYSDQALATMDLDT